jgi:hydrogenase maturation protease
MTVQTLVIGFGNPLRQDDGFGWRVAERLESELCAEGVQVIRCHQIVPELAQPVSRCRVAIFVDVRVGEPSGMLECERLSVRGAHEIPVHHAMLPDNLLALAKWLYGSSPSHAYLLTVRSTHFGHDESLSPAVEPAVDKAVAWVRRKVRQYQRRARPADQTGG